MRVTHSFDLVVIGTGSAGGTVASRCRAAGWKVAIVDSRPFGGTCALRGCDPKKVLVGVSESLDWAQRMKAKGIQSESLGIDWQDLMRFKRSFTTPVPKSRQESFAKAGIDTFHGRARFVGPTTLQVGDEGLEARRFVVAAGQKPADLNFPGSEYLTTSDQFLELDRLPQRILFVGGGYIAFEFAHVAARAGAQVTIIHRGERPLSLFDPDLVDQLVKSTRELGVAIHLGTEAVSIEKHPGLLVVRADRPGESVSFESDLVVHGGGRVPEIADLGLDAAGVEWTKQGVAVNDFLQSVSNPAVYAAGDAAAGGGPRLTPVAGYDGVIVASNLLKGNHRKPNYRGTPTVVFTIPPLGAVGFGEREARNQGLQFTVKAEMTPNWYSSRRVGERYSGFKVLVEDGTDRILGAHLLGAEAAEVINLFALAIQAGLSAADLKHTLFAYPTRGSDVPYML